MSASVRVGRRGRAGPLICVGAAVLLASGGLVAALLALTSVAAGSLVTAATHRPGPLDNWRRPAISVRASAPAVKTGAIFAEHDASFGRAAPEGLGERLAAFGERLLEARATLDPQPSAARLAALEPLKQSGWRDAMMVALGRGMPDLGELQRMPELGHFGFCLMPRNFRLDYSN